MAETGVNKSSWDSITRNVSSSTAGIAKLNDIRFSRTDLIPFTTFSEVFEEFNKSINKFKGFTSKDAYKMEQAGQNKLDDDAAGASAMTSGGGLK